MKCGKGQTKESLDMSTSPAPLRVLVVAPNASAKWGGEAILPIHIFRGLREKGQDAYLCVGEETRPELDEILGADRERVRYVADSGRHELFRRLDAVTPKLFGAHPYYFLSVLLTQLDLRRTTRKLVRELDIDIVHQPTPVSPKAPSLLTNLGAPLVVGPMNGGMEYPEQFRFLESSAARMLRRASRLVASPVNAVFAGKRQAACLLVANQRTARALPRQDRGVTIELPENAVDPELWNPPAAGAASEGSPTQSKELELIFIGRLVRWKGAEWLIDAFAEASRQVNCRLTVVGDHGDERARLTARATELGIASKVSFLGWQPQTRCAELLSAADALVLPSVFECGGAVVLEAMACGKPVIAAEWGGPADYLDPSCGFLVPPRSPEFLVSEVSKAIVALATNEERRIAMGRAGRQKVLREFTWPAKIDKMIDIYRQVLGQPRAADQNDDVPASHERTRSSGAPKRASA